MRKKLKYKDDVYITAYDTKKEKELLVYLMSNDVPDIDDAFFILADNISCDVSKLTTLEKKAILFNLRAISIGEGIECKFKCNNCKQVNDTVMDISDIIEGVTSDEINDCYEELTDDTLHKFVNVDVDDLSLEEYDELFSFVDEKRVKFNFIRKIKCLKCGSDTSFDVSDNKYIIESLSEDSLMSIYQTVADLVYYGKYSKLDVDSMLPFERTIFVGLLNKTTEKLSS